MKKFLRCLLPYREAILGILVVGLFVSVVQAVGFEPSTTQVKKQPKVSSTSLKIVEDNRDNQTKQTQPKNIAQTSQKKTKTYKKQLKYPKDETVTGQNTTQARQAIVYLTVSDGPQAGNYQFKFLPGNNVFQIMSKAKQEYGLEFSYTQYSLGAFIDSIGGLAGDNHHFWALYYNGSMSMVGAADLHPINKDKISWKYTSF